MNARSVSSPNKIEDIIDQCVKCGLCLPHCPTYRLTGNEIESPRGRLELMRLAPQQTNDMMHAHDSLAHCLACGQCERHCPIQVPYLDALTQTRQQTHTQRHWLRTLLASPRVFALLLGAAAILPASLRRHLPLGRALANRPVAHTPIRATSSHQTGVGIAMVSGCTGHAMDRAALSAVARIATILGCQLTILPPQCCGSLHRHVGDLKTATALQSAMRTALETRDHDIIVHLNTGCDQQMRMLGDTTSNRVMTVVQWLVEQSAALSFRRVAQRVAVHHPCTSSQSERQGLEHLLRMIPGLDIEVLAGHAGCCGAAGDQFLKNPARTEAFTRSWLGAYVSSGASIVLSSNIGCSLHLSNQDTISATIVHPVVFLATLLEPSA